MTEQTDRQLTRRFSVLNGAFFASYAGTAFLSYLLMQKQMSTALIGVVGALVALASAAVQPLWGLLCDRYCCHRLFYVLGGVLAPLIYFAIAKSGSVPVLIVCALLSGCFIHCLQNMSNGWVAGLNHREGRKISYSSSRGWGSLAYALAAILFGQAVLRFGDFAVPALMGVFCTATIAASFAIPRIRAAKEEQGGQASRPNLKEGLSILLHRRSYVAFVFCCFLGVFALAGISTYFPVLLAELGGNSGHVGMGNFAMAFSESVFMMLFGRLIRKISFRRVFSFSLIMFALECVLVGISPNSTCTVLALLTQGLSYGLVVPCSQHYTFVHIDPTYTSTAQLFSSAVGMSASMVFGNLFAGFLSGFLPLRWVFLVLGLFPLAGLVLYRISLHWEEQDAVKAE